MTTKHWHLVVIPCRVGGQIEVSWSTCSPEEAERLDAKFSELGEHGRTDGERFDHVGILCENHAVVLFECPLPQSDSLICQVAAMHSVIGASIVRWCMLHPPRAFAVLAFNKIQAARRAR